MGEVCGNSEESKQVEAQSISGRLNISGSNYVSHLRGIWEVDERLTAVDEGYWSTLYGDMSSTNYRKAER